KTQRSRTEPPSSTRTSISICTASRTGSGLAWKSCPTRAAKAWRSVTESSSTREAGSVWRSLRRSRTSVEQAEPEWLHWFHERRKHRLALRLHVQHEQLRRLSPQQSTAEAVGRALRRGQHRR